MPWKESDVMDQKLSFVLKALREDVVFTEVCEEYGVTRATGRLWRSRFLEEGMCGLHERSRRPKHSPQQLDEATVCRKFSEKGSCFGVWGNHARNKDHLLRTTSASLWLHATNTPARF
jgi:transposase